MENSLILATGFILGLRHAFDPDHITAVTQFISLQPNPRRGIGFGLRWGLGHAITVLAIGSLIILSNVKISLRFEKWAEILVGVTLITLALWRLKLLYQTQRHTHLHQHDTEIHSHPHSHLESSEHVHSHAPTLVGMLHGAAGTLAVFVLIPLSFLTSKILAYAYILTFGLGCMLSMGVYGLVMGHFYRKAQAVSLQKVFTYIVIITAFSGLALGIFWVGRNL